MARDICVFEAALLVGHDRARGQGGASLVGYVLGGRETGRRGNGVYY